MVDATLAELVGGEMLFPGKATPGQDREQRITHMRKLFAEGVTAVRQSDFVAAMACFNAILLCCSVAASVHADQVEAEAEERDAPSPGPSKRGD